MIPNQRIWSMSRNRLAAAVAELGYPEEFADLLAKELGGNAFFLIGLEFKLTSRKENRQCQ